jgi:hypothetical protein
VALTTVMFYFITVYTPTFGRTVLKLTDLDSLLVTLCVAVTNFIWLPVGGAISDRIGRKAVLLTVSTLAIVTAYPALSWLIGAPSFASLLVVDLTFSLYFGIYNGAMVAALSELVPAHVRASGFSLAYSLAAALFGTFTPLVSTSDRCYQQPGRSRILADVCRLLQRHGGGGVLSRWCDSDAIAGDYARRRKSGKASRQPLPKLSRKITAPRCRRCSDPAR